ncbi:unnamed protein product [Caenorhabditis bovis]|uniref:Secreted protein n=1 Tax=Caenorhabditis bovis TaxID=2654633 RepID=A0A8S1ESN4_9PELO|nr:unnamed protein product [Caenorhabditis bovis]
MPKNTGEALATVLLLIVVLLVPETNSARKTTTRKPMTTTTVDVGLYVYDDYTDEGCSAQSLVTQESFHVQDGV